ncbi:hypothetical protein [Pseudobacillus wudalianchiensis]|uniref:hypothetical protein n=1 Tax=Pseudobacillus wudalianchiensis TaxID=1743143 RepID=UPI00159F2D90|nr:hypothetical protein [Bacillus wudalianchiensis]
MDKKKYFILLLPALILLIILVCYLPAGMKQYAIMVPLVFWAIYYGWIHMERKHNRSS